MLGGALSRNPTGSSLGGLEVRIWCFHFCGLSSILSHPVTESSFFKEAGLVVLGLAHSCEMCKVKGHLEHTLSTVMLEQANRRDLENFTNGNTR